MTIVFDVPSSQFRVTAGTERMSTIFANANNTGNAFFSRQRQVISNVELADTYNLDRYQQTNACTFRIDAGATLVFDYYDQLFLLAADAAHPFFFMNGGTLVLWEKLNPTDEPDNPFGMLVAPYAGDGGTPTFVAVQDERLFQINNTASQIIVNGGTIITGPGLYFSPGADFLAERTRFKFADSSLADGSSQLRADSANLKLRNCQFYGPMTMQWLDTPTEPPSFDVFGVISPYVPSSGSVYGGVYNQFTNLGAGAAQADVLFRTRTINGSEWMRWEHLGLAKEPADVIAESAFTNTSAWMRGVCRVKQPVIFEVTDINGVLVSDAQIYLEANDNSFPGQFGGVTVTLANNTPHDLLTYGWDTGGGDGSGQNNVNTSFSPARVTNFYSLNPYAFRIRSFSKTELLASLTVRERYSGTPKLLEYRLSNDPDVSGDKATIDAVPGWAFTFAPAGITITADLTNQQIYNGYKSALLDNMSQPGGFLSFIQTTGSLSVGRDFTSGILSAGGRITIADTFTYTLSAAGTYPRSTTMLNGSTVLLTNGGTHDLSAWEFEATVTLDTTSASDATVNVPAGTEANISVANPSTGGGVITVEGPPTSVTFTNIPEIGTDFYIYDAVGNVELANLTSTVSSHVLAYAASGAQIRVQVVFPAGTFQEINSTFDVGDITINVGAIADNERNYLNP